MKTLLLSLILLPAFLFFGCKKYEEGPGFSLRSKKERVSNDWKASAFTENGVDKLAEFNAEYQNGKFTIAKTGNFIFTFKQFGITDTELSGKWYFNDDKTKLLFNQTLPITDNWSWDILKLKERELWIKDTDSADVNILQLIPF